MIVFHDFFYKSHPHYLDRAVGMMELVNNCGIVIHSDFEVFIKKLKATLKEDGAGRYERNNISLSVTRSGQTGQIQIIVKDGLDYSARIDYNILEKGFAFRLQSEEMFQIWAFDPEGQLRHVNRDIE